MLLISPANICDPSSGRDRASMFRRSEDKAGPRPILEICDLDLDGVFWLMGSVL